MKGAVASHRRAKEKTGKRQPILTEGDYFATLKEEIEIEDDDEFDDDPSPEEGIPDPYADR